MGLPASGAPSPQGAAAKRVFGTSTEFIIPLGTPQREDALKRYPEAKAEVERRITILRQEVTAQAAADTPPDDAETAAPDLRELLGFSRTTPQRLQPVDHALVLAAVGRWHQKELFRINRSVLNGEYPNPCAGDGAYQAAAEERYRRTEELRRYDPRLHPDPDAKVPGFSRALFAVLDRLGFAVPVSHAGLYPVRLAFREAWMDILQRETRWVPPPSLRPISVMPPKKLATGSGGGEAVVTQAPQNRLTEVCKSEERH